MKVSYNWLNKYFDGQLPAPDKLAEALTFHAWEIEETYEVEGDTVLDVKVLPDKSMWGLSHRGIAKDLSVILSLPLKKDPISSPPELGARDESIGINLEDGICRRFAAARIKGVKVGPSPEWLKKSLEAIGQRSINNIVDASNYVMFDLGQPSHAFDASLVGTDGFRVRAAKDSESLMGLDRVEYKFSSADTVIARADTDEALSVAGLKGGQHSGINDQTTEVLVEVANWDPVAIRKTGQRLKLRTDASARYENGIVPEMVPFGLKAVSDLIVEVAGGTLVGYNEIIKTETTLKSVSVSLSKLNSVLGVSLDQEAVSAILDKFGWSYEVEGEAFSIKPPFERTDLVIAEDLIEEIGRIYGYEHVAAVTPEPLPLKEINSRFYYNEIIRQTLVNLGWSEIYTSSFRQTDQVKLANAFAADKGYLRSTLTENMNDALAKNAPNADLLGIRQIKLFEIGTVFGGEGEHLKLSLGVRSPSGYKAKIDDAALNEATEAIERALGTKLSASISNGVSDINLGEVLSQLPKPTEYKAFAPAVSVTYRPYSVYPSVSRDIAMWIGEETDEATVSQILKETAGPLCVRISLFDKFAKDGRTSYAFRLVFQSNEKTLAGDEVNAIMDGVYQTVRERSWEVR